jgi:hypothetical protein
MPDESKPCAFSGPRTFFFEGRLETTFFVAEAFFGARLGPATFFVGAVFFRFDFFGAVFFFFAATFFRVNFFGDGFRADAFFVLDDFLLVFFLFAMVAESTTFRKEGRRSLSLWELAHAPPVSGSKRLGALRQIDKAEMAN